MGFSFNFRFSGYSWAPTYCALCVARCVLRVAYCVLRVAYCVLRAACCAEVPRRWSFISAISAISDFHICRAFLAISDMSVFHICRVFLAISAIPDFHISRSLRTPSEEFGKNCQYFRGSSLQPRELRFGHGSWCLSTRTQSLLFLKLRFVGSYSTLNHDLSRRKKSSGERNKLNLSIASGKSLKYSSVIGVDAYVMET